MPLTKPSTLPRFATAGELSEPTEGKKDNGWIPGEKPPAQHLNWLFFWIYSWIAWLNDLTNQALVWTALHVFQKGIVAVQGTVNGRAVDGTGSGTGAGVRGTGGATNGTGVEGFAGSTSGAGVLGVGGTTAGVGVVGTGAGAGVSGTGVTNGAGVIGAGAGTGNGVEGQGGSTSGVGVRGVGGTGSPGVRGTGGSGGAAGVDAIGSSGAPGITALGSGIGQGIVATGGATSGAGGRFVGGGAGGVAIDVGTGNLSISGAAPTKTADPGFQLLSSANVLKAWAHVTVNATALTVTSTWDGYGIASIAWVSGNLRITLARTMTTSGNNFCVNVTGDTIAVHTANTTIGTTVFEVYSFTISGGSWVALTGTYTLNILVHGRQ